MLRSGKVVWSLLVAMLILVIIGPALQADPGAVTIYQVDDQQTVDAGYGTSFQWVVYNNGSDPQLITVELDTALPSRLTYLLEPTYVVVEPGEGQDVFLNITASRDMYTVSLTLQMQFNVTDMITEQVIGESHSVVLDAHSFYGDLDRENKVLGIWDNFLPAPLDGNWGAFSVSILIWVGIAYLIMKGLGPALHSMTRKTSSQWDDVIIEVIKHPLFLLVLVFGMISSLEILELDPGLVADLELAYLLTLVVIGALLAYRLLVKLVVGYGRARSKNTSSDLDDAMVNAVEMIGKIIIPVAAIFIMAGILGMDLGGAILGLGFLGIIIGYALQPTLGNFFSGLQLMIDRPFKVGDRVPLENGHTAEVRKIGMRITTLHDLDTSEDIIVPNSLIENQTIINMNAPDVRYKVNVKVRVGDFENAGRIEELMMEASRRTSQILQGDNAPVVRVSEIKDGRMLLTIFIWVDTVFNRHIARTEYRTNLYKVFNENGVEFALPRKMVWLNRE
ncbi:MAG TPA: mechanosensitive ion channel family protein [Methanomassiliicoccales archaeon]|nr:mechanosensitive ion channel family protein [Methanomassiliicoccales archaeon]